jgi:glycyl-radical enzyme activating protein
LISKIHETGIVFDIQRFSLNDGPGIRTTVFLKGCPLRSIWCHNPESWQKGPELYYTAVRCTFCRRCWQACPRDCHSVMDGLHTIDRGRCTLCGDCVKACPMSVLEIKGIRMNIQDVMDVVLRDKEYYLNSDGGVTLSGGEPMAQPAFALALLRRCREEGIHTCLETCGYAPESSYREILPFVSLFLYDFKATGPSHKALTGVEDSLILSNLDAIIGNGGRVVLRCPMVPGVNDSNEHLQAIASLERRYPGLVGIDILPYHNMGSMKAGAIGKRYAMGELQNTSDTQKAQWLMRLGIYGTQKARIV